MRKLLLGADIGTSGLKAVVFDENGQPLYSCTQAYDTYYPAKMYVEQNPEDWYEAFKKAVNRIFVESDIKKQEIIAIGIDGQSWSAIAVNKEGKVLIPDPIWLDVRSSSECEDIKKVISPEELFKISGNPLSPSYSSPKQLWIKKHHPDVYKNTYKFLQCNSYLVYRLTDVMTQDISQAYGFHFFNMEKGIYDVDLARETGIDIEKIPEISPCSEIVGSVTKKVAEETGLMEGTKVVAGGLDAACGTLGAGVLYDGQTQEQGGQAGGMSICSDSYIVHPKLICGYHVVPGKWLLQGGTVGGGSSMKWIQNNFGDFESKISEETGESKFKLFCDGCENINPGSDGLIFLPYLNGERSPIWDAEAKGVFYGMTFAHNKKHFVRSVMEGVAFALRHNIETAEECGAFIKELVATGGSAQSPLWVQIKADVTKKHIEISDGNNTTALGAAILAGIGVGLYKSFEEAVEKTVHIRGSVEPNEENYKVYDTAFDCYKSLYPALKDIMHKY